MNRETFTEGLKHTLERVDIPELGPCTRGKVREGYVRGDARVLITTDRLSAFDRILGTLPYKGQVLNRMAAWWFDHTKSIAPNHVREVPDPNVLVAEDCTPLAAEFVVRAYLTGVTDTSIWTHYSQGKRTFCGHALPDGLKKNDALPKPILTPSTKAEKGGHDVSVSRQELLAMNTISERDFDEASEYALALFAAGQKQAEKQRLILADTKYEFGKTRDGRIVIIDEMHTPDSSRYWQASSYKARLAAGQEPESFDKELVRRWLKERGYGGEGPPPALSDEIRVEAAMRYAQTFESITGTTFTPDASEPIARIRKNLHL